MQDECICISYGLKFMRPNSSCQYFLLSKVTVCREKCVSQTNACWFWIRETESQRYVRVWAAECKSSKFQKAPHIDCGMGKNDFPVSARLQLPILLGCCHQYNVLSCWLTDIYGFGATGLSPCPVSAGVNMNEIKLLYCRAFTRETFEIK